MLVLVVYECDNGENCHCHRREWQEVEELEVADGTDLSAYVKQLDLEARQSTAGCRNSVSAAYVIASCIQL